MISSTHLSELARDVMAGTATVVPLPQCAGMVAVLPAEADLEIARGVAAEATLRGSSPWIAPSDQLRDLYVQRYRQPPRWRPICEWADSGVEQHYLAPRGAVLLDAEEAKQLRKLQVNPALARRTVYGSVIAVSYGPSAQSYTLLELLLGHGHEIVAGTRYQVDMHWEGGGPEDGRSAATIIRGARLTRAEKLEQATTPIPE